MEATKALSVARRGLLYRRAFSKLSGVLPVFLFGLVVGVVSSTVSIVRSIQAVGSVMVCAGGDK